MPSSPASAVSVVAVPAPEAPTGSPLLSYLEDMLLELAHMASAGGEPALAATLAVAAIHCGAQLHAAKRREAAAAGFTPATRPAAP